MANRLSQLPVEVALLPVPRARLSQLSVEAAWLPVPGALLSQLPVEVATTIGAVSLADVLSQLPVEVAAAVVGSGTNPGLPRATQTVTEPVTINPSFARTTQSVLEVVYHGQQVTIVIQSACFIAVQTDFPIVAIPAN